MTRRRALGAFPDRVTSASSDSASAVTLMGSKVIGLSTLGVALLATAYIWASTVLMLLNGAAVLAVLFWIGVAVWRQVGRGSVAAHCVWGQSTCACHRSTAQALACDGPDSRSRRRRRRCACLSHPCCPDRRGRHHRASTANGSYPQHRTWATLPGPQLSRRRCKRRNPGPDRAGQAVADPGA